MFRRFIHWLVGALGQPTTTGDLVAYATHLTSRDPNEREAARRILNREPDPECERTS